MYGLVDFRVTQPATTGGYPGLLALARQLVGERLLFARRGYPDELKLHFGTAVESLGPKGRTLTRGSYVLGCVASTWAFKIAHLGLTVSSDDVPGTEDRQPWPTPLPETKLDEFLAAAGGQTVVGVEVQAHPFGYALSVSHSDGSVLAVTPTPGGTDDPPPDWELFTPYGRYLRVGPGPAWAYLPSDEPE